MPSPSWLLCLSSLTVLQISYSLLMLSSLLIRFDVVSSYSICLGVAECFSSVVCWFHRMWKDFILVSSHIFFCVPFLSGILVRHRFGSFMLSISSPTRVYVCVYFILSSFSHHAQWFTGIFFCTQNSVMKSIIDTFFLNTDFFLEVWSRALSLSCMYLPGIFPFSPLRSL